MKVPSSELLLTEGANGAMSEELELTDDLYE